MFKTFFQLKNLRRWLPLFAVALLLLPLVAHAQSVVADAATDPAGAWDTAVVALSKTITGIASAVVGISMFIAYFFALMLGKLSTSAYIFDTGMGDTLQKVWVVSRNFVNIGFIFILLVLAVQVILGIGSDGGIGTLKKVLPKLILALIAVNLTFFAARFILTANDVLAASIFTLPRIVGGENLVRAPTDCTDAELQDDLCLPKLIQQIDLKSGAAKDQVDTRDKILTIAKNITNGKERRAKVMDWVKQDNIGVALLMNMVDLNELIWNKSGNEKLNLVSSIGSMVIAVVTAVIFFMLFLAFLIRIAVLWLMIAFAPLGVLAVALGEVFPSISAGGDVLTKFVKHAFMPTLVAMPISASMIMLFAHEGISFTAAGFLQGTPGPQDADALNDFGWWVLAILVLWKGVDMAIEASSEYAHAVTGAIKGKVEGAASSAAEAASYLPILPKISGVNISPGALFQTLNQAPEMFRQTKMDEQKGAIGAIQRGMGIDPDAAAKVQANTRVANAPNLHQLAEQAQGMQGNYTLTPDALAKAKQMAATPAAKTAVGKLTEHSKLSELYRALAQGNHADSAALLKAAQVLESKSPDGSAAPEMAKPDTGVESALAGTTKEATEVQNAKERADAKTEDGKQVWEIDIAGKKHLATKSDDGKQFTVLMSQSDLDGTINSLDNSVAQDGGQGTLAKLKGLAASKQILSEKEKDAIDEVLGQLSDEKSLDSHLATDLKTAYEELMGGQRQFGNVVTKFKGQP